MSEDFAPVEFIGVKSAYKAFPYLLVFVVSGFVLKQGHLVSRYSEAVECSSVYSAFLRVVNVWCLRVSAVVLYVLGKATFGFEYGVAVVAWAKVECVEFCDQLFYTGVWVFPVQC